MREGRNGREILVDHLSTGYAQFSVSSTLLSVKTIVLTLIVTENIGCFKIIIQMNVGRSRRGLGDHRRNSALQNFLQAFS